MTENAAPVLTKFPTEFLMAGALLFTLGMGVGAVIGMLWTI